MKIKKILIAILIGVLAAIVVIICIFIRNKTKKLPENAKFLDVNLQNMTVDDVGEVVDSKINNEYRNKEIKLDIKGSQYNLKLAKIDAHFDKSDVFKFADKNKEKNEDLPNILYDEKKLRHYVEELAEKTKKAPTPSSFKKLDKTLVVTKGTPGYALDFEDTINKIKDALKKLNFDLIKTNVKEIISPEINIDLDKIKKQIQTQPKDASFKIVDGKRIYEKEVIGVDLDIEKAKKIIGNQTKKKFEIPLEITMPKKTEEDLKQEHKKPETTSVLGSFTTKYKDGGDRLNLNRIQNMKIAANAINGIILLPGESFSFAATAGKAGGYLEAKTYTDGKLSTGIGGGICQVSSTLFNAALEASMDITQRSAHSRTVDYVKRGLDATFDSGGTDFRFTNPRSTPVVIGMSVGNGSVTSIIKGKNVPGENYKTIVTPKLLSKSANEEVYNTNVRQYLNDTEIRNKNFRSTYKKR